MTNERQADTLDQQASGVAGATTAATVVSAGAAAAMAASLSAGAAASALDRSKMQLVPAYRVLVDNLPLPPAALADLIAITVYQDLDVPSMFTIQLLNWDMNLRRPTWSDNLFSPGSTIAIQMGYVDRQEQLLVGEITGLEPEFAAGEVPTLTVRGYDRSHQLLREQRTRAFVKMKDSDIARQIAAGVGLSASVIDSGVTLDYVLQHNQSDGEFLRQRARRIGYELLVVDRTLHFRPYQHNRPAALTLRRDVDLIEFFPRLTTMGKLSEFAVRGWNPADKQALVGKAAMSDQTSMGNLAIGMQRAFERGKGAAVTEPVASQAEADQVARGQFNAMVLTYITGSGVCIGRADLQAGSVIALEGLGRRFSGNYYVTTATHTYAPERGYRTAFDVKRNAT